MFKINNKDEIVKFLMNTPTSRKMNTLGYTNTIIFTNANGWYVKTLVNNLMKSNDSKKVINLFVTDEQALNDAKELGMPVCYVDIPDLKVNTITEGSTAGTENYVRMTLVKIVLIRQFLEWGYDVLYIDPDMAFVKGKVSTVFNELLKLRDSAFAKCFYSNNVPFVNSNIIRAFPKEIDLFRMDKGIVEKIILSKDGSDEDLIKYNIQRIRIYMESYLPKQLSSVEYPAGGDTHYMLKDSNGGYIFGETKYDLNVVMMYHANCFIGLNNKIKYNY